MDTPVLLAIISTVGVLLTGLASVAVAAITNRRESKNAADDAADEASKAMLEAKDERIVLRDEQIKLKEAQLGECLQKSASVQGELQEAIEELNQAKDERWECLQKYAALQAELQAVLEELAQARDELRRLKTDE